MSRNKEWLRFTHKEDQGGQRALVTLGVILSIVLTVWGFVMLIKLAIRGAAV
jgi:hypothetical protein